MKSKTSSKVPFNRHVQHRPYPQYGLLGKSSKEPIADNNSFYEVQLLRIPKSHLGVGTYQRPIDENRVFSIRNDWRPNYGIVQVKMFKSKGRYYYQIVDGQHRAAASPDDSVTCILSVDDNFPVDDFMLVNSSRNVKSLSTDDFYWAHIERIRHFDSTDLVQAKFVYDTFKKFGYNPERTFTKVNDFGTYASIIHKFYFSEIVHKLESKRNSTYNKVKSLLGKNKSEISMDDFVGLTNRDMVKLEKLAVDLNYISDLDSKDVLNDVFNIMVNVFGKETFNDGKKRTVMWQGLMRFLVRDQKFQYDVRKVITALKIGKYSKNGRGKASYKELKDLDDWNNAVKYDYHRIGFKTEQWQTLFRDTFRKSSSIMNSDSYESSDDDIKIIDTVEVGEVAEVYA